MMEEIFENLFYFVFFGAFLLIYKGVNINVVSISLGHSKNEETLDTYTQLYLNDLINIPNLIDKTNES